MTDQNQVHGHEVMHMMLEQGKAYTRETLREAMVERFGDNCVYGDKSSMYAFSEQRCR